MTDITPAMAWSELLTLLKIGAWFVIPWAVGVFVIAAAGGALLWMIAVRLLWGRKP